MPEPQNPQTRLVRFEVTKLFGEFHHLIPLSLNSRITALIAPNGMGKTVCLRLINALFRRQWSVFASTEFEEISFTFSNGASVVVRPVPNEESPDEPGRALTFTTVTAEGTDVWSPRVSAPITPSLLRIEQYLPFLSRTGPTRWVHDQSRQTLTLQEVIDTYGDRLPESVIATANAKPSPVLGSLIDAIDCHLIETQRLLIFPDDPRRVASTLAISSKAQRLRAIISKDLAAYATLSQSLDRTFPRRVMDGSKVEYPANLEHSLIRLDELRRKLMEAGVLDTEADVALLPAGPIDQAMARVLNVYVTDTERKLNSLSGILAKISLFKELIDDRFRPKAISVDREKGFAVTRGSNVVVPLEKLSSGEQHQLVLFFELLFELKENALILIDEPELSLHVAWQKKFIPDLQRIIALNGFDVLLATHSPQLIGHWDDLVVELGSVDAQ